MATDVIRSDRDYTGNISFSGVVSLPEGAVTGQTIAPGAEIGADKVVHRHAISYAQANGVAAVVATQLMHVARAAGTIIGVAVRPGVVPVGGDLAAQIDIQKATDGSATWTSILTAVIAFTSASLAETAKLGTLLGPATYQLGDAFRAVVTVSGTTGTQLKGFVATLNLDELPV